MIDIASESVFPLTQATNLVPRRRRGRKTNISTLYRWSQSGLRGECLETIQIGGTRCTSREALQRFFERLSRIRPGGARDEGQSHPTAGYRSRACRQRASERAARGLESRGS
jgi:hypothetical protein